MVAVPIYYEGVTVIRGFHSPIEKVPIEKDCLRILLRGKQPIIVCVARALDGMRIPQEWHEALNSGRLLLVSPFADVPRRASKDSARRRNEVVAGLTDNACIINATPGGTTAHIAELLLRWGVPQFNFD